MTAGRAAMDALRLALPDGRHRSFGPYDAELFEQVAQHGLTCARAAYRFGDRGEALVRATATNMAAEFWRVNQDPKADPPQTAGDRLQEAGWWQASARALLAHAQRQKEAT